MAPRLRISRSQRLVDRKCEPSPEKTGLPGGEFALVLSSFGTAPVSSSLWETDPLPALVTSGRGAVWILMAGSRQRGRSGLRHRVLRMAR